MKIRAAALMLGCAGMLGVTSVWGQRPKPDSVPLSLAARIEVDAHEHSFTVRFFLKNKGENDADIVAGRGGGGMNVVPHFHVADVTIIPPLYTRPPRRGMSPDIQRIPAGKEILYGTFTMGYPPTDRGMTADITASFNVRDAKLTLRTESQRLKIPATKLSK